MAAHEKSAQEIRDSMKKRQASSHLSKCNSLHPLSAASHIRAGAEWVSANRDSLPLGFVASTARLYRNVYDEDGHNVVDSRGLLLRLFSACALLFIFSLLFLSFFNKEHMHYIQIVDETFHFSIQVLNRKPN